jgi:hypothetical protein
MFMISDHNIVYCEVLAISLALSKISIFLVVDGVGDRSLNASITKWALTSRA